MIKIVSWNVNGIRASLKKGLFEKLQEFKTDIFCVQETKSDEEIMISDKVNFENYTLHFHSATLKKGYSGVATYSLLENKTEEDGLLPLPKDSSGGLENPAKLNLEYFRAGVNDETFDIEGRFVLTKYQILEPKTEIKNFIVINAYYPQGGRGQYRIDYKIEFYKRVLEITKRLKNEGENIVLCGDFNTTFTDIDLARPKENQNNTGCLPEEREALNWFVENGFVDAFRHFNPEKEGVYTYWDQKTRARDRNVGWRIDYFLVDKKLIKHIKNCEIHTEILGSDHCPISLEMEI
jgi:exodeoxyribonuclease-3